MLADAGCVAVGKAAHVVYLEYLEYILNTDGQFHIGWGGCWLLTLCCGGLCWEQIQAVAVVGVGHVAWAQIAIEAFEVDDFAPTESLDEWQAVEDESVHIIGGFPRCVGVGDKFHWVHERKRFLLYRIGEVGAGDDEQRVGYVVPYTPCLGDTIYVAER